MYSTCGDGVRPYKLLCQYVIIYIYIIVPVVMVFDRINCCVNMTQRILRHWNSGLMFYQVC